MKKNPKMSLHKMNKGRTHRGYICQFRQFFDTKLLNDQITKVSDTCYINK